MAWAQNCRLFHWYSSRIISFVVQAWGRRGGKLISTDVFVLCRRLFHTVFAGNSLQAGAAEEVIQVSDSMFLLHVAKVAEYLRFNLNQWSGLQRTYCLVMTEYLAPGHFVFLSQCTVWILGRDSFTIDLLGTLLWGTKVIFGNWSSQY